MEDRIVVALVDVRYRVVDRFNTASEFNTVGEEYSA